MIFLRASLRNTLLRLVVVVVLSGSFFLSGLTIFTMLQVLPAVFQDKAEDYANLIAMHLDGIFFSYEIELKKLIHHEKKDLFPLKPGMDVSDQAGLLMMPPLHSSMQPDPHMGENAVRRDLIFDAMLILDDEGYVQQCFPADSLLIGFDYSRNPLRVDGLQDLQMGWSVVSQQMLNGVPSIALNYRHKDTTYLAVARLNGIWSYLHQLRLSEGFSLSILDSVGTLMYHPDPSLIETRMHWDYEKLGSDDYPLPVQTYQGWLPNSMRWGVVKKRIPSTDWRIVVFYDRQNIFKPLLWLIVVIIVISLGMALFMGFVGSWLVKRFFLPVETMIHQMEQVCQGQPLSGEVMEEGIYSELESLQYHFWVMIREVQQRQEELDTVNRRLTSQLNENETYSQAFTTLLKSLSSRTGLDFLESIVQAIKQWSGAQAVWVGELRSQGMIFLLARDSSDHIILLDEYAVRGTPCEHTIRDHKACVHDQVLTQYPSCRLFQSNQLNFYYGLPLQDSPTHVLGVLVLASQEPLAITAQFDGVTRLLAERCVSEIMRSQHEQSLKRLNENLGELSHSLSIKNRELENILFATSHDLKKPIVNMTGFLRELFFMVQQLQKLAEKNQWEQDEDFRRILDEEMPFGLRHLQEGVDRMESLTQGIFKLFRVNQEEKGLQKVRLNSLVEKTLESMAYELGQHQVDVSVDCHESVNGDVEELTQVMQNLITNAMKYRHQERPLQLKLYDQRQPNGRVHLKIEDNGRGIYQKDLDNIFKIFFRSGDLKGIPGDGLGLSFCYRIMEQHKGEILVESVLGKGSCFILAFPSL